MNSTRVRRRLNAAPGAGPDGPQPRLRAAHTLDLAANLTRAGAAPADIVDVACAQLPAEHRQTATDRAQQVLLRDGALPQALVAAGVLDTATATLLEPMEDHPEPSAVLDDAAHQLRLHTHLTRQLLRARRTWTLTGTAALVFASLTGVAAARTGPSDGPGALTLAVLAWLLLAVVTMLWGARAVATDVRGPVRGTIDTLTGARWSTPPASGPCATWCHLVAHTLTSGATWDDATATAAHATAALWGTGPGAAPIADVLPELAGLRAAGDLTGETVNLLHALAEHRAVEASHEVSDRTAALAAATTVATTAVLATFTLLVAGAVLGAGAP